MPNTTGQIKSATASITIPTDVDAIQLGQFRVDIDWSGQFVRIQLDPGTAENLLLELLAQLQDIRLSERRTTIE